MYSWILLLNLTVKFHTTGTPAAMDAATLLRRLSAAAAQAAIVAAEAGEASPACLMKLVHAQQSERLKHDLISGVCHLSVPVHTPIRCSCLHLLSACDLLHAGVSCSCHRGNSRSRQRRRHTADGSGSHADTHTGSQPCSSAVRSPHRRLHIRCNHSSSHAHRCAVGGSSSRLPASLNSGPRLRSYAANQTAITTAAAASAPQLHATPQRRSHPAADSYTNCHCPHTYASNRCPDCAAGGCTHLRANTCPHANPAAAAAVTSAAAARQHLAGGRRRCCSSRGRSCSDTCSSPQSG